MAVTIDRVRDIALALPAATEVVTWGSELTWRVRDKIFAMGDPSSPTISVKASREDQTELIAMAPETYSFAPYVGRFGWVAVRLVQADPDELGDLIVEAWRRTAPKRLVAAYDATAA